MGAGVVDSCAGAAASADRRGFRCDSGCGALPDAGLARRGDRDRGFDRVSRWLARRIFAADRRAGRRESRRAGRSLPRACGGRTRRSGWAGARQAHHRARSGIGSELRERNGRIAIFAQGFAFRTQFGALGAQLAPPVTPGAELSPAVGDAFADDPETDGGGKVESGGGEHGSHHPGALQVEVNHQQAGHEAAYDALHRKHVQPAPMPRQEAKDGGQKGEREQRADPAQDGRAAGPRAHPRPAHAAQPQGEQKGREAQRLQQQVADVGAKEADPVVGRGGTRGRVERGVRCVTSGQGEEKKQRDQHQHHPEKDVHGAAARGRENNADGLHDKGGSARRLPCMARQAEGAGKSSQSKFYYRCAADGAGAKSGRGNHRH